MFKERFISGIVLVILMAAVLYAGGPWTLVAMLLLSVIGLREFYRIFKLDTSIFAVCGYLFAAVYYLVLFLEKEALLLPLFILFFLTVMTIYVFSFPKYKGEQAMTVFFGFIYTVVLLSYIYRIRMLQDGGAYVVLAFLSSWGNDTFAYCVGRLIGKHKMSPKLSPKKSVEGAIGGILGAGLLGLAYGSLGNTYLGLSGHSGLICAVVCLIGAFISIVGDLAASAFKRDTGIKDYGKLIPGHGGVLDRFDSIIFTAPIVYYGIVFLS
ncbi:MAG: phosphatidate cytidylyltransferase [Lachnospiraceae bacterium]|nr:phosphatidate cytidylyltransferase [Lachnospiraceae bacterium]